MVALASLVEYSNSLLNVDNFKDYCPNGLQVEGRSEVKRLVSGVTASRALLEQAVALGADAIVVHHGYFWRGEDPAITGIKRKRLSLLLTHDISLLGYHLPLDAHPELGNNAQFARRLELTTLGLLSGDGVGNYGKAAEALSVSSLTARLTSALKRRPLHISGGPERIERLAWCTGAAQGYIEEAVAIGCDAYISGEISEPTVHIAREAGIHYFAAGHHATERYGVHALGEHLRVQFGLDHRFVDLDNPV